MKKFKFLLSAFAVILILSGCEKDKETEGISRLTNYVEINLEGDATEIVALGSQYVEPGYVAYEGDVDVTENVKISDNIDVNVIGVYTVVYEAINKDGFSAGTSRTVVVYDPSSPDTDISGTYAANVIRTESDGSNPRERNSEITINKVAPGMFYVNCLLGYFYAAGYGPAYAMTGYIQIDVDGDLTLVSSYVAGWGDGLAGFNNGVLKADGSLYWESIYAGNDTFTVKSTK